MLSLLPRHELRGNDAVLNFVNGREVGVDALDVATCAETPRGGAGRANCREGLGIIHADATFGPGRDRRRYFYSHATHSGTLP